MSHVATIELQVKDIDALERSVIACGLEFHRGQTVCHWEGSSTRKVSHVIRLAGFNNYEIGVQQTANGDYSLIKAAWLPEQVRAAIGGNEGMRIQDQYAAQVAISQLQSEGYSVNTWTNDLGEIIVEATQ